MHHHEPADGDSVGGRGHHGGRRAGHDRRRGGHPGPRDPGPERDPVAFFRAQQAVCAHHAAGTGNPTVEPDRFSGASWVRDPGDGAYLVQDGQGTRLVVGRATGIVLPTSGRPGDLMPAPCGFGCPETVFIGAADG